MQDLHSVISSKSFQIYAVTEYGNLLFSYSPKLSCLSEQHLRILPISISFTSLKKYCFQRISLGKYTGSIVHNKQVIFGFFTKSKYSPMHFSNNIYFLYMFLSFLNCKPSTLSSVLATEKEKTDRQGYEFSVNDLKVEHLNNYNEFFVEYKEILELTALEKYEECYNMMGDWQGFIMNIKGEVMFGEVPGLEKIKELVVNMAVKLKTEHRNDVSNVSSLLGDAMVKNSDNGNIKVELKIVGKKIVLIAGFCPCLNGFIVGLSEEYQDTHDFFTLLNNCSLYFGNLHSDSDHGSLAKTPEYIYNNVFSIISFLCKTLKHIVPKDVKGSYFSHKISPKQSIRNIIDEYNNYYITSDDARDKPNNSITNIKRGSEDYREKSQVQDLSLNFGNFEDECNVENTGKEPIHNLSIIEKEVIEEENDDLFLFTQERITPGLVKLEEIIEEEMVDRDMAPSRLYYNAVTPVDNEGGKDEVKRVSKNGRWFRKSTEFLATRPYKPEKFNPKPPLESPRFARKAHRSKSSKDLNASELLDFDDYKKLGIKDIYEHIEKYANQNHRPSREYWLEDL